MKKIGDSTNTANASGEWSEGNPAAGLPATLIKADWLTTVQRELVGLVLGAGIPLDKGDDGQILKAVVALAGFAADFTKLKNLPTTVSGFGIKDAFTKSETSTAIQTAISALVASSPTALDTLNELASALGNDPNFATTMTNALASKAAKATTLNGYGITNGVEKAESGLSAVGKVIAGKVSDLTVTQFFTLGDETIDKPADLTYGAGLHMKYPGDKYGIDIAGGIAGEWFGFRKLSAAGLGVWRALWHDGNFNPSDKADKATTYTKTQVTELLAALVADPWAVQPIGVPIPVWRHLGDETVPPRDKAYRYIKLTASDAYNAGVLSSEIVSGSEPLLLATAVVSLAGSPFNGRTVSLINTERRVLRGAEASGELLFDAVQGHAHMQAVGEDGVNGNTPNTSNTFDGGLTSGNVGIRRSTGPVLNAVTIRGAITDGASGALRSGGETRAKSISVTYYLRIK